MEEEDSDIAIADSIDDAESKGIPKLFKLTPGGGNKVTPKGNRGNGSDSLQFIQSLLLEATSSRQHRQNMNEFRLKARLAKVEGTEEQRSHELQLLKFQHEIKKGRSCQCDPT